MSTHSTHASDFDHILNQLNALPRDQPLSAVASTRILHPGSSTPSPGTIIMSPWPHDCSILLALTEHLAHDDFPPHCRHNLSYSDVSPHVVLPGLIDTHVHLNEPGPRTEWEGFETGTSAALAGGVTTVIDMPLNSIPPTTDVASLEAKKAAARDNVACRVGFYGGVVPGNVGRGVLKDMVRAGVKGFKGFLCDSGVPEFPAISEEEMRLAMRELEGEKTVLMFHAEKAASGHREVEASEKDSGHGYAAFLASRLPAMETDAVEMILANAYVAPELQLHVVHLSAKEVIPLLSEAREKGLKVTSETCFHYLHLSAEEVEDGDARFKCCPPVRERENQEALWKELEKKEDSVIQTIVSDHSPCTPNLKILPSNIPGATTPAIEPAGDFFKAWGGISSLGLGLSILNTERLRRQTFDFGDIARWCATNPARQIGWERWMGQLEAGMKADLCVFDDEAEFVVQPDDMHFRNKCSPYQGRRLRGVVRQTWLNGRKVYDVTEGGICEPSQNWLF